MEKTADRQEQAQIYEVGFLLLPTIAEEKIGDEVAKIKEILAKHKAEIISEEAPKLQPLSYVMVKKIATANKRFQSSYFGWVKFEVESNLSTAIKNDITELPSILRVLLIKTVRESTLFSAKLAERESAKSGEKSPMTTEDLDKSIEKTVEELAV